MTVHTLEVTADLYSDPRARLWLDSHHCVFETSMLNSLVVRVPDDHTLVLFLLCWGDRVLDGASWR